MTFDPQSISSRLQNFLRQNAQNAGIIHHQYLQSRQISLEQIAALLEMQIAAVQGEVHERAVHQAPLPPALFDIHKLEEFATGSMANCFGPEFKVFEGRRYPRIPNGDLLLMSRIKEISGQRHRFNQPASIVAEYDVPPDAWFYRNRNFSGLPYSVWMEIALQPCGFLSAYLGTSLLHPNTNFFFRNLDGNAQLFNDMDISGKTITCKAQLLSTVDSDDTIIQTFAFDLSCQGQRVFQGKSIFGFFPPEAMARQAGLDSGKTVLPTFEEGGISGVRGEWVEMNGQQKPHPYHKPQSGKPSYHLAGGQLNFIDRVFIADKTEGKPGEYLYAVKTNDPQAWFYRCHFFQDPVMPGSLGVEAILEAMQVYALRADLGKQFKSPRFGLAVGLPFAWKYRGQILPDHKLMKLEVKITRVEQTSERVNIVANASLWADSVRIYEVKNAAVCLEEESR